jgi:hypothetical protein
MLYALLRLLDAALKEQGFALSVGVFGWTPSYPDEFTRAPVRNASPKPDPLPSAASARRSQAHSGLALRVAGRHAKRRGSGFVA